MLRNHAAIASIVCALIASIGAFSVVLLYDDRSAPAIVIEDDPSRSELAVSIEGGVVAPGVYRLEADARLGDAITEAGGLTAEADVTRLNLAERLRDEQQIVIPVLVAVSGSPVAIATIPTGVAGVQPVNINTAEVGELDVLPGIGPAIAQRIVDYREANGPFTRVQELARVDGISPAMVTELGDMITVGP